MPEPPHNKALPAVPPAAAAPRPILDEPPPFLRTWPRVYTAVMLYLAGLLLILAAISRAFHYL